MRPLDGIQPGRLATAVGKNFPAQRLTFGADLLGIYRHHDALRPHSVGRLPDEIRIENRRGVDSDLVRPGIQHGTHILNLADAAANSQRYEDFFCDMLDNVNNGVAIVRAGGNIKKSNLVSTFLVIATRNFDRITGITDIYKLDTFDDATVVDIQAGNNAFGQ